MRMHKTKILLITIVVLCVASICQAQEKDSLEAKLAKLEAATKAKQSHQATEAKLVRKKKTLAEKIAELEARQKGFQEAGKGRDTRMDSFESKLAALQAKLDSQQNNKALAKRITQIEQKVLTLENQSKPAQVQSSSDSEKTDVMGKLELNTQTLATAPRWSTYPIKPIAVNFLDTTSHSSADHDAASDGIWHRETLTNGFWGLNDKLADSGIEVGFGITSIYQTNTKGGTSTNERRGRYTGSYDLEVTADMQKLLGIEGGTLYVHGEGWGSKSGGIDAASIGSAFGVNGDAGSRDAIVITEFWWEQAMFDDTLKLRFGKLDITGGFECRGCPVSFDGSAFANDETGQFLNSALINNPTIPFPDYGLGAVLYWNPIEWWYASVGVVDAQGDARETGFRTAFHGEDYFFYVAETGIAPRLDSDKGPLQGTYRVGLWYDPQPKANTDRTDAGKSYSDDVGFYTSCDQILVKENSNAEDTQGLGAFFRYGYAPSKTNDITNFFSLGFQYQGLLDGRDDDVVAIGYAQGVFSDTATSATYPEDYESALELYYNALVTPWFSLSPSIQYVANPGGVKTAKDAVVFALRAQITF